MSKFYFPESIDQQLQNIIRTHVLLLASDFDGTLAPFVLSPEKAQADQKALAALKEISRLPCSYSAIISGRSRADLALRIGEQENIRLIGSHGLEYEEEPNSIDLQAVSALLDPLSIELKPIVSVFAGTIIERKPYALTIHYRSLDREFGTALSSNVLNLLTTKFPDLKVLHSKKTLEVSPLSLGKGASLRRLTAEIGATGVIFLGDDITDEDAFRSVSNEGLGIKVGEGASVAAAHLDSFQQVAHFIDWIAQARKSFLETNSK